MVVCTAASPKLIDRWLANYWRLLFPLWAKPSILAKF